MPDNSKTPKNRRIWRTAALVAMAVMMCTLLTSCIKTGNGETINVFTLLIVKPFAFILRLIYDLVNSYGLAIILFSLLTKLIMLPISIKQKKSMNEMQKIQPQLKAIQEKYKNDKQKQSEEMTKIYQAAGVNPVGGCLPTLIMFPILIGLYWPISQPLKYLMKLTTEEIALIRDRLALDLATSEITIAQMIYENFDKVADISEKIIPMDMSLWGMNLGATPSIATIDLLFFLPLISGLTAFAMTKLSMKMQQNAGNNATQNNSMMMYMSTLMSVWFGYTLPAGLCIYWIASNVFSILQELFLAEYFKRKPAVQSEKAEENKPVQKQQPKEAKKKK